MADKSQTAKELAAKLHSANSRVVTANDPTTSPVSQHYLLNDASALIKEVISVLMEGETDYYGNHSDPADDAQLSRIESSACDM